MLAAEMLVNGADCIVMGGLKRLVRLDFDILSFCVENFVRPQPEFFFFCCLMIKMFFCLFVFFIANFPTVFHRMTC